MRIEEASFLPLGGIEQFITIRGDDTANPVLLLLHGGPGDVQSPFVADYAPYEDDFTLVQWDQRGAGRTFGRNGDSTPDLTLDRVVEDGLELTQYLEDRFGRPVIILGHSWGSVIGVEMARRRPDLFTAYVGTGQVGGWDAGVLAQYEFVQAKAEAAGDQETLDALDALTPFDPKNVEHFLTVNRPMRAALGPSDAAWLDAIRTHTEEVTSAEDLDAIGGGMNLSGLTLYPTQIEQDLFATASQFEIPFFVIQGREDLFTPTDVAISYFNGVQAPQKQMVVIEGAGHFALVTHQEEFLDALLRTAGQVTDQGDAPPAR